MEAKRAKQVKRAKLLARRRRTTMLLFLGFTVGAIVVAVGGLALLWVPAVPAVLLSAYIAHMRGQERRRFAFTMDQRQAEAAARDLRERRSRGDGPETQGSRRPAPHHEREPEPPYRPGPGGREARPRGRAAGGPGAQRARGEHGAEGAGEPRRSPRGEAHAEPRADHDDLADRGERGDRVDSREEARARAARAEEHEAAERRALVEQTDHAEWVDQQRAPDRENPEGEGWEPVPVPLPTYVSAPVAPRTTRNVDLEAPDAWSSARSSTAPSTEPGAPPVDPADEQPAPRPRRTRDRSRTPLFDQYEDEDRPRAANE